jgi:anti-sigma-K factor RskA
MSEADDDKDVLAAEFVLGTLDVDDRANAQMLMAIDPDFVANVARWERRLGELHTLVGPVDPPKSNWDWIKARIASVEPSSQMWLPGLEEAAAAAAAPAPKLEAPVPAPATPPPPSRPAEVVELSGRVRRWQQLTVAAGAIAATVAGVTVLREARPVLLPEFLRPVPQIVEKRVEVVREVPSQRMAEFVAVFQRDDALPAPAFLMTVDVERRTVSIRRVGAETQPDRSYQLWIVTPQQPQPRSLGLLEEDAYTVRRALADYDAPTLSNATFGISVEPPGGSPTGQPTGPVIHGRLIQATPAAFPAATP